MKPSTAAWVGSDSVAEKHTVSALLMEAIWIDLRLSNIAIKKFGSKQSIAGHATLGALKYHVRAFSICASELIRFEYGGNLIDECFEFENTWLRFVFSILETFIKWEYLLHRPQ